MIFTGGYQSWQYVNQTARDTKEIILSPLLCVVFCLLFSELVDLWSINKSNPLIDDSDRIFSRKIVDLSWLCQPLSVARATVRFHTVFDILHVFFTDTLMVPLTPVIYCSLWEFHAGSLPDQHTWKHPPEINLRLFIDDEALIGDSWYHWLPSHNGGSFVLSHFFYTAARN